MRLALVQMSVFDLQLFISFDGFMKKDHEDGEVKGTKGNIAREVGLHQKKYT